MSRYHLAQVNIAQMKFPTDDPRMAGFMNQIDGVNALADAAPGFVWRLQTDDGNATAIRAFPRDDLLINLSVWESVEALRAFVYKSGHVVPMRGRAEWFDRMSESFMALWWVPEGHVPSLEEAKERLASLQQNGPSPEAFTFRTTFPPPGESA